ncbi:DUF2971 domain-containing protein [Fructobacillus cardui]|uniref:DUF2971 domain-containing protein n=1 Tax=Fructobacillus cardui TaxID=2893170 RepID=A0ABM9MRR3_9LACO|nr:hypothetical protein R82641_BJNNKPBH_00476 [Fructobacillus cardui]
MTKIYLCKNAIKDNSIDDSIILIYDNWDDYGFVTTFNVYYYGSEIDENENHYLGYIKIASTELSLDGQRRTYDIISKQSDNASKLIEIDPLSENIYSIAPTNMFYKNIFSIFEKGKANEILEQLKDITILSPEKYNALQSNENLKDVLQKSLLRTDYAKCVFDLSNVKNQYSAKAKSDPESVYIFLKELTDSQYNDECNQNLNEIIKDFVQNSPFYQEAKFIVEPIISYIVKFELQDTFQQTIDAIEQSFPSEIDLLEKITNHKDISNIVADIKNILSVDEDDLKNETLKLGHYTNTSVLPKLISSTVIPTESDSSSSSFLRLTNSRQLNDPTEGKILFKYLTFKEMDDVGFIHSHVYIASASTSLDNLPMWKQYGDDARGVCLVYDNDYLVHLMESYGSAISICKVFYLDSSVNKLEQLKTKNEREERLIDKLIELRNYLKKNDIDSYTLGELERLALCFKSDKYSYEEEYRIMQNTEQMNEEDCHFTLEKNKTFDFPFLYLYLEKVRLKYKEVILGTKSIDVDYIGPYLKHCEPNINIKKSEVPYR